MLPTLFWVFSNPPFFILTGANAEIPETGSIRTANIGGEHIITIAIPATHAEISVALELCNTAVYINISFYHTRFCGKGKTGDFFVLVINIQDVT